MRQAPGELMAANPYKKREPNIREQVYGMLRQDIALGKIGFDVRLVDNEIAASLNVSRMPVRLVVQFVERRERIGRVESRGELPRRLWELDVLTDEDADIHPV